MSFVLVYEVVAYISALHVVHKTATRLYYVTYVYVVIIIFKREGDRWDATWRGFKLMTRFAAALT